MYDIPAVIDYTLKMTGEFQVNYIAFSMANAQLFSLLSEKPSYNKKVRIPDNVYIYMDLVMYK